MAEGKARSQAALSENRMIITFVEKYDLESQILEECM